MSSGLEGANCLVVGGAGFVGSALLRALLRDGAGRILIVDNLLSADRSSVPDDPRVTFIGKSINDEDVLRGLPADLDFAWHLACYHGNQSSIANPLADHEHGALSSLKLFARLVEIRSLRKVVYASAGCAVAAKTRGKPAATLEDAPVSLIHDSPYSISKLVGEMYGNYFLQSAGLPFVKARFQNVYGPGEILGAGAWRGTPHTVWRNVVPTFVFRALHSDALPLDAEGKPSRDFIFVEDVAEGLIACAANGQPGEAYNIASGVETTIRDLADLINREAGNSAEHDLRPARDWDRTGRRYGDPAKAKANLGFAASTPLAEGIARTVAWTRENMVLIKACMARHGGRVALDRYLSGSPKG